MGQLSFAFSREQLDLLTSEEFRIAAPDSAFVDYVLFAIGQSDAGGQLTPIQFGPRLRAVIETLRDVAATDGVEQTTAELAEDLAEQLTNYP